MFTKETMKQISRKMDVVKRIDLVENHRVDRWINGVNNLSLAPPRKSELVIKSAEEAKTLNCPLPLIVSLCPAIKNLEVPNSKGQTRELVELSSDNDRLAGFVEELFDFNSFTLTTLGVPIETMVVFADVLEIGAENMFTNIKQWSEIVISSVKNISKAFSNFDSFKPGEFQKTKFKIPKVRLQSNILTQAGKVNLRHEDELRKVELACLNPNTLTFDMFIKHLKLTANTPFVATGFQTIKSAETVWNRVRFMLSQCAADGIVLPKMMKELTRNNFPNGMPNPIFVCSTVRPGGIGLEMDAFEMSANPSMAVFKNIGSWMKNSTPNEKQILLFEQ